MHLTGTTSAALIERPPLPPLEAPQPKVGRMEWQRSFPMLPFDLAPASADWTPVSANAVFFSHTRNFLEKQLAYFHYSVIGRFATVLLASGYVGSHLLNDDDAASNSEHEVSAACAEQAPSFAQKTVIADVSTQSSRLHFRTGERKINANDCDFGEDKQVDITFPSAHVMRIDENIHATTPHPLRLHPSCIDRCAGLRVTVAPPLTMERPMQTVDDIFSAYAQDLRGSP